MKKMTRPARTRARTLVPAAMPAIVVVGRD